MIRKKVIYGKRQHYEVRQMIREQRSYMIFNLVLSMSLASDTKYWSSINSNWEKGYKHEFVIKYGTLNVNGKTRVKHDFTVCNITPVTHNRYWGRSLCASVQQKLRNKSESYRQKLNEHMLTLSLDRQMLTKW